MKIAISLGLLVLVLRQVGWQQTWQSIQGATLHYLTAALALALISIVVRAYRWKTLLDALGMSILLPRLAVLYFVGAFFSNFLPTGVGGDVVRVYELARQSDRPAEAIGTVLVDRATGLLILFLMALVSLIFSYRLVTRQIAVAIVLLALVGWGGLVLVIKRDWLEKWGFLRFIARMRQLEDVYEAVYACGLKALGRALAVSFVLNVLLIVMNYLIALSLGVRISLWYFLLFIPIISFLLALPVSLSGLGVREGGYVYLFSQAGVAAPLALTMSLVIAAFNLIIGFIGGILYALEGVRGLRRDG